MSDLNVYTTSQINALTPITGDMVVDSDLNAVKLYDGAAWRTWNSDSTVVPFNNEWGASFDGSNDYLDLASFTSFDLKGLSLWVKPDHTITYNSSGIDYVIGLGDGDEGLFLSGDLSSRLTDEVIGFAGAAGNYLWGYSGQGVSISTDWHHIAITWNISNSSTNPGNEGYDIYLDGNNVGNDYGTWGSGNGVPFTCDFVRIGARNRSGGVTYRFGGGLDDIAVFDVSLSSSDVTDIYNSGVPTDISSLSPKMYYRFGDDSNDSPSNGGTIASATDSSGNGNDATQSTASNQPTFSDLTGETIYA